MGLLFNRGGCDGHHFGDGKKRIREATVTRSSVSLKGGIITDVLELKVPMVAECQHEGCSATKTKRVRKQYVLLEDICKDSLEVQEKVESR